MYSRKRNIEYTLIMDHLIKYLSNLKRNSWRTTLEKKESEFLHLTDIQPTCYDNWFQLDTSLLQNIDDNYAKKLNQLESANLIQRVRGNAFLKLIGYVNCESLFKKNIEACVQTQEDCWNLKLNGQEAKPGTELYARILDAYKATTEFEIQEIPKRFAKKAETFDDVIFMYKHAPLMSRRKFQRNCLNSDFYKSLTEEQKFEIYNLVLSKQLRFSFIIDEEDRRYNPITRIKKETRQFVKLRNEETIELDATSMHLSSLLAKYPQIFENKESYNKLFELVKTGEIYEHFKGFSKSTVKLYFMWVMFKPSSKKLIVKKAFKEIHELFEQEFPDIFISIQLYKQTFTKKDIEKSKKNHNGGCLYHHLTKIETAWMQRVSQRAFKNDLPMISIHDGLLCRKSDQEFFMKVMFEESISKSQIRVKTHKLI